MGQKELEPELIEKDEVDRKIDAYREGWLAAACGRPKRIIEESKYNCEEWDIGYTEEKICEAAAITLRRQVLKGQV